MPFSGTPSSTDSIGGFSENDWKSPWAKEVFEAIGVDRKKELLKLWKVQRDNDIDDWHNDFNSR